MEPSSPCRPVAPSKVLMPKLILGAFIILALLTATSLASQVPEAGSIISGVVHGEGGMPLSAASVVLRSSEDSTVAGGAVTDPAGVFRIRGVVPGRYVLEASHIGYLTAVRRGVEVGGSGERVELGIVSLDQSPVSVEGVEIIATPSPIQVLADRTVYSTRDLPGAFGGTAAEVLQSVPELEVSVDGGVTRRGARPSIHINGRPAPMQGEALDAYLQQLPAERIDRIEVISDPSSRFEAEGQGGIVNIVTSRSVGGGLSGSAALSAGTRHHRGGSASASYEQGRLTMFGSASTSLSRSAVESSDLRHNLNSRPAPFIQQDSHNHTHARLLNADLGIELVFGAGGALWADVGTGRNAWDREAFTAYTHLDAVRNPTERYDRVNDRDLRGTFGSGGVGYRHSSASGAGEWSIELRRSLTRDDHSSLSARYALAPDGSGSDVTPELTLGSEGHDQSSFSLDSTLKRPWGEAGQVEIGYRGVVRNTADRFLLSIEGPTVTSGLDEAAGDFRNHERTHAGFVSGHRQAGRFLLTLGMRGERTEIRRALPLEDESVESSYTDLFPSASISTALGNGDQLGLSYSRRVDRPWGGLVNPVRPALDPLNRSVGNPYLLPRYTHSFSFTATRAGRTGVLQLSPFYRRTTDGWEQIRTVDEAGVSTVKWSNLATTSAYGGAVTASLTRLGPLSGFLNVRGYRESRDGGDIHKEFSGSSTHYSAVTSATIRATSALSLQASLTYLPSRSLPQGRISSMLFSTVGMRQQVLGRRGSVNLSVVDPFELQRFTFTTRDGTHVQTGSSSFSARRGTIGFTYRFGQARSSGRQRGAPEEGQLPSPTPEIR